MRLLIPALLIVSLGFLGCNKFDCEKANLAQTKVMHLEARISEFTTNPDLASKESSDAALKSLCSGFQTYYSVNLLEAKQLAEYYGATRYLQDVKQCVPGTERRKANCHHTRDHEVDCETVTVCQKEIVKHPLPGYENTAKIAQSLDGALKTLDWICYYGDKSYLANAQLFLANSRTASVDLMKQEGCYKQRRK